MGLGEGLGGLGAALGVERVERQHLVTGKTGGWSGIRPPASWRAGRELSGPRRLRLHEGTPSDGRGSEPLAGDAEHSYVSSI